MARAGIEFRSIANPAAFKDNPRLAWGFYGHRLALYRNTVPHDGFRLLKLIAEKMPYGAFVTTSNVDGQFQKEAGFEEARILEVHGSIHRRNAVNLSRYGPVVSLYIKPTTVGDGPTSCQFYEQCQQIRQAKYLMFNDLELMDGFPPANPAGSL